MKKKTRSKKPHKWLFKPGDVVMLTKRFSANRTPPDEFLVISTNNSGSIYFYLLSLVSTGNRYSWGQHFVEGCFTLNSSYKTEQEFKKELKDVLDD